MLSKLKSDINKLKNSQKARDYAWFFKTGAGEYGEGDKFLGLTMPQMRSIVKKYLDLKLEDIQKLLDSKIHEYRMIGVLILVKQYENAKKLRDPSAAARLRDDIFFFYLKNSKRINNWDLVDLSAPNIVGNYLLDKKRDILYKYAQSKNLWKRRIAVISTAAFINQNDFKDILKLSKMLLNDKHDLIHKATGWMLREVGKRDVKVLEKFLDKHTLQMPRTMLRYSIEKFDEKKRKYYLIKK